VDRHTRLAIGIHEPAVRISYALWFTRSVLSSVDEWIYMPTLCSDYYRQTPPKVPHFLKTLLRRKLVLWFLASEILRDYWLSGVCDFSHLLSLSSNSELQPYGRNWTYLWSVPIPKYQILILIIIFFVGVWAAMLLVLTHFSKTHTWLLPIFAVGLGAPRWCQVRRKLFNAP
jgi:alpha-1,3-glucan synthase